MVPGITLCWPVLNIPIDVITPANDQAQNMDFNTCSIELRVFLRLLSNRVELRNK
jgi:hypothetical protein